MTRQRVCKGSAAGRTGNGSGERYKARTVIPSRTVIATIHAATNTPVATSGYTVNGAEGTVGYVRLPAFETPAVHWRCPQQ
jgi:hypothetical protein